MLSRREKELLLEQFDERMREVVKNLEQAGILPALIREYLLPMVSMRQLIEDKS